MNKRKIAFATIIFFSIIFSFSLGKEPLTTNIDFSGVEKFLLLTAILEEDKEPTPAQWDALFETPGYAVLIQREFRRDFFIERFKLAFMPSKKEALKEKLKEEKGFWAQFLPHYIKARYMRKEIEAQIQKLKTMSFVQAAVKEALLYLPKFEVKEYPPISFVIFGPDARGYSPVVIDVLYSISEQESLIPFIAHEFHHYYRNKFFTYGQNQDILWVIDQIQAEGIADQINVGKWFHDQNLFPEFAKMKRNKNYVGWYAKSPEIIQSMDVLFSQMADHPEKKGELGSKLRRFIPLSGHPTGFFMANVIIEELGKDTLIKDIGNPFSFFYLYKKAADKKGEDIPTFSDKTIKFIRHLENKYMK